MKLSRTRPRWIAIACVMLTLMLALPAVAFASLNDPASGTSETNPNLPPELWHDEWPDQPPAKEWRQGWGNSFYPEFTYTGIPSSDPAPTLGFLYNVTRREFMSLPATDAQRWDVSWDTGGPMVGHTLDMPGIYNDLPLVERSYNSTSGQISHDPLEGRWYFNKRWFNESDIGTGFTTTDFGIDVTPPRPVIGFTSGVSLPTETHRRKFTWVNTEYDDMSRGAFYELYVNDMKHPVRYIQVVPWMPGAATIEDLPPGVNTVGIRVMDRARNESLMVTHTEIVDPDYPDLSVSPGEGSYVRGTVTFSAVASDSAGITKVSFVLDGTLRQSSATARSYSVNTTNLRAGKHTLEVFAYDLFGHARSLTRTFYVDNTAPGFSSVSHSPDPWYPCLQDGYKDTATFSGYVNEYVTDLFCQIYDEDGTTLLGEGHVTNAGPGKFKFTSNGRDKDGNLMNLGTIGAYRLLKWRFTAKDRAGNWRNMAFQTIEVRNFEIVDNPNGGGVKVIPR